MGDGGTVIGGVIIGGRGDSGNRIEGVRPDTRREAEHAAKAGMGVRAGQISTDVARDDASPAEGPVQIQPDNRVGSLKQILGPPDKPAFRDPGRLRRDLPDIGVAVFY